MRYLAALAALLTIVPLNALATDYYVDKTAAGASDSNNGRSPTTNGADGPWLTVGKCASTLGAGDTCNVLKGLYDERPALTVSGTAASRIVYNASQGVVI